MPPITSVIRFLLILRVIAKHERLDHSHVCENPPSGNLFHMNQVITHVAFLGTRNTRFRITPIYTPEFNGNKDSEKIKKEVVQFAIDYWSQAIKPKYPSLDNLRVAKECVDNKFERILESNGQVHEYCTIGCLPATSCSGVSRIPENLMDQCRMMVDGRPVVIDGSRNPGLPNTDYILFVDASNSQLCQSGLSAYATVCQIDTLMDRKVKVPTMGYINFCPGNLALDFPRNRMIRYSAMHEMAHAFGFSSALFALMRYENGEPRTPRDNRTGMPALGIADGLFIPSTNTIEQKTSDWKSARGVYPRNRTILKTENVLNFTREHFGCPTLDGVELESQGAAETASSHFEKRLFLNELMTGSSSFDKIVSPLILSYFQDTGWYHVDMSKAEVLLWGKGAGCDFALKSCLEYMEIQQSKGQSFFPWCNEINPNKTACLTYANAYGTCGLDKWPMRLPKRYQYFQSIPGVPDDQVAYYGGGDPLVDFCPYWASDAWIVNVSTTFCNHEENTKFKELPEKTDPISVLLHRKVTRSKYLQESYGLSSICFNHDQMQPWRYSQGDQAHQFPNITASCHTVECIDGLGLIVKIGRKPFVCPVRGGSVQVNMTSGTSYVKGGLECPPCDSVCRDKCPSRDVGKTTPDSKTGNISRSCADVSLHARVTTLLMQVAFGFALNRSANF